MELELTEVDSSDNSRKFVLDKLPVMIGQDPDSGVQIDDQLVSRQHCEINAVKGTLVVRDLGSMLGTFVNGLSVSTALLMPGDKLTVGITSFLVDYERRIITQPLASSPSEPPVALPGPAATQRRASPSNEEEAPAGAWRLLPAILRRVAAPFRRKPR